MAYRTEVVVIGESAGGISAAVRAARLGLDTLLVTYKDNPGGVLPSLGAIETHYTGCRCPFLEEVKGRILTHYREHYGEGSEQYAACRRLEADKPFVTFEPHVMSEVLREIIAAEPRLTVWNGYYPISVELQRDRIVAVRVRAFADGSTRDVEAAVFVDATYEGDLAACAGVPYRIGRESRREYDEPHAGRLFTRYWPGSYPHEAVVGKLNLLPKRSTFGLMAGSTGEGDDNIQDYSFRLCLSCDPTNRRLPDKPPGYDRSVYLGIVESPEVTATKRYALQHRFLTREIHEMIAEDHLFHGMALPNHKRSWNATNFPAAGKDYPEADWPTRHKIARRHVNHALGILYFLQNDEAVPQDVREQAGQWGLARDEFTATDNIPPQMYIREARRIRGRYTFTENDALLAPGLERAPIHEDSVAITDFPLDSLPCTTERRPGTLCDGQFFLMEQTRPGQVPYRVLLPQHIENLLVPVTASVTHVAWGTVRQVPTLMQLGEVCGYTAALSQQIGVAPGKLPVERLQQALVENGVMVTFFNDLDMATEEAWVAAVEYLGAKGFFASYDARPRDALTRPMAQAWAAAGAELLAGASSEPSERARRLPDDTGPALTASEWAALLAARASGRTQKPIEASELLQSSAIGAGDTMTRGEACRMLYQLLRLP